MVFYNDIRIVYNKKCKRLRGTKLLNIRNIFTEFGTKIINNWSIHRSGRNKIIKSGYTEKNKWTTEFSRFKITYWVNLQLYSF